jgi:putative tryptophan/tyrosine transport system substrate-binding protein
MIGRRELLAGLGAVAAPAIVRAQTRRAAVVGFVGLASEAGDRPTLAAFRRGLADIGRPDGPLLRIEARHAGGDASRVGALISELAAIPVDVFLSPGQAVTRALRRSTQIPVVAIGLPPAESDPELFETLARPGGTITGFSSFGEEISAKRTEILQLAIPDLATVGVLHNTTDPSFDAWGKRAAAEIGARGLRALQLGLSSSSPAALEAEIRKFKAAGGRATLVVRDFLTSTLRDDICRVALDAGVAVAAESRDFAEAGALFSYGADVPDLFRRAAGYADRILNGEKAGELPIQLPAKFDMVLNLKTAKALGLAIAPALLARADEVIE